MMKKIILLIIAVLAVSTLTACGGYSYYIPERETTTDEIEEVEVQQLFDEYGGTWAYSWDEDTYQDLWFYYYNDNISVCIDSTMDQSYIDASILAVEEFDALEYISITWHMSDDPQTTDVVESCPFTIEDEEEVYEAYIVFTVYSGSEEPFCSETPGGDDDTLGCNSSWYDDTDGSIGYSIIKFNSDLTDDASAELKEHVALHELGHSFGLDDLYDDILEPYSVMYWQLGDIILVDLTEFDKMNLEWMYVNKE
jgi:predicted small lipoprotein YifL